MCILCVQRTSFFCSEMKSNGSVTTSYRTLKLTPGLIHELNTNPSICSVSILLRLYHNVGSCFVYFNKNFNLHSNPIRRWIFFLSLE